MSRADLADIDILHSDRHLLVISKAPGLATVPGKGEDKQDSVIKRLLVHYPNSRVVHRLDQPTSGILLIPQSHEALSHLGRQFAERAVKKRYVAVVDGHLAQNEGEVDLPLICDWPNRPRQMVCHNTGKNALTCYRLIQQTHWQDGRAASRVSLTPVTGRSHQLRVHMLELGHPILGDWLYGPAGPRAASDRLLLHAEWIEFTHPISGERLAFTHSANF